jgi:hypothetical protein
VAKSDGLSAQSKMFYSEWFTSIMVLDGDADVCHSASQETELVLYTDVDMCLDALR